MEHDIKENNLQEAQPSLHGCYRSGFGWILFLSHGFLACTALRPQLQMSARAAWEQECAPKSLSLDGARSANELVPLQ